VPLRKAPIGAALAVLLAGIASGCGAGSGKVEGPVSVYVSLPLTGARGADGRDAADGARLALEQAGGRAGDLEGKATYLDDANGERWDPVAVGANARQAIQDSGTAAYIGELDSEATRASLPITNDAGIVQISPGAGGVDLTQPAEGYPDSPDRYRPSGDNTFVRLVPNDLLQARAAAEWAEQLGFKQVQVVSDDEPYGDLIAEEFTRAAEAAGVEVLTADSPAPKGRRLGVFFSGESAVRSGTGGAVFPSGATSLLGTDALLQNPNSGVDVGFFTAAALDPSRLPDPEFVAAFEDRFGRAPGPYAAYGFEAMTVALLAVEDADGDSDGFRGRVVDAALDTDRADSVLGRYSISGEGETTLCAVQRYEIEGAVPRPGAAPCPGA
jgi:branched-chain amino acid transport system substrate-binding protein